MSIGLWKFLDMLAPVALDPEQPLVKDYKQENTRIMFRIPAVSASDAYMQELMVTGSVYNQADDTWEVTLDLQDGSHEGFEDEDDPDAPIAA